MERKLRLFLLILSAIMMLGLSFPAFAATVGETVYSDNDFTKLQTFLEQLSADGVTKNGTQINTAYNKDDPATWSGVTWVDYGGILHVSTIGWLGWNNKLLDGVLDVSGFIHLQFLDCADNQLDELNTSLCTELARLNCSGNRLGELDVSTNTALEVLICSGNRLTRINASLFGGDIALAANGRGYVELFIDMMGQEPLYANAVPHSGATFSEWTDAGTRVSTDAHYSLAAETDYDLTANFLRNTGGGIPNYTVNFDLSGGTHTGGGALVQTVPYSGAAIAPATTRDGYVFDGWDKDFSVVTSNLTVTAQWTQAENEPVVLPQTGDGDAPMPLFALFGAVVLGWVVYFIRRRHKE